MADNQILRHRNETRAYLGKALSGARHRYVVSIVIVLAATALRLVFLQVLGTTVTFITCYPAIIFAALYGGMRAGLLATVLSALLADYFWMEPTGSFGIAGSAAQLSIVIFLISGVMISWIAEAMHLAQARTVKAEMELHAASERARAADALRESERRYKALASASFEGIVVTEGGRNIDANDQWLRMLGYSREEFIGTEVAAHVSAEDRDRVLSIIRAGNESHIELTVICKDGKRLIVEAHGKTFDYQNRKVRFTAIRDITERKQAEMQLAEAMQRLEAHMANSPLAVIEWGPEMRLIRWSHEAERIFGWTAQEVLGKHMDEFRWIHEQDAEHVRDVAHDLQHGVQRFSENRNYRKDGAVIDCHWYNSALVDQQGHLRSILSLAQDVTAQKRAEEVLHRYELLASQSRDIILFIDREDRSILDANPAAIEAYGCSRDELLKRTIHDLRPLDTPAMTEEQLAQADEQGILFESIHQRRDGSRFPVEVSARTITVSGKRNLVSVIRDITQRKQAEDALRQSEQRLRTMADAIPQLAWIANADGYRHWYNRRWYRYTGSTPQQMEGWGWQSVHDPQALPRVLEQWKASIATGEPFDMEFPLRSADGQFRRFLTRAQPIKDEHGQVQQWFGTNTDVEEMRRGEETLQRLNRTLKALASSSQAMSRARDEAQYMSEVCRIVVEDCGHAMVWIGYAQSDPVSSVKPVAWSGFVAGYLESLSVSWADTQRGRGPTGTAIRTGQVSMCRNMLTDPLFAPWRAEALKRGYASSIALPLGADGRTFGALTVYCRDPDPFGEQEVHLLSELASDLAHGIVAIRLREAHVQALASFRQSEERYRSLFTTLLEGFCIIEVLFDDANHAIDYRFLEINPAFATQTGLHNALGKRMRDLAPQHETHWFEVYGQVALTGRPTRFINHAKALNRWFDVSAYRIGGPDSKKVAILFSDITERKRAEDELTSAKVAAEQAKVVAEAASKAKDHFLAVLSHELRNPLNPVLATAAMLRKDARFDADTHEQLEVIHRNAELEARLIDDLLDVTRIERGKVELDRRPIELGTIIRRAAEVCRPDIEARQLEFGIDMGQASYLVNADAARLQQVFWNLIKNAVKFTAPGGFVGVRCRSHPDGYVIIEVNDSGEGIEPEALFRIFNAFEQAERSITRQFGGLGLGLTISKGLVDMHGGSIKASSEGKGKGATFTVQLPLLPSSGAVGPAVSASAAGPPPAAATRPLRILLVEDHGDSARIMTRLLSGDGHEVRTAADVATAIKLASETNFDLLLSDLGLPDGTGLDLMRALRAKGINFPAIALSGYGLEADVEASRNAGFTTHLTKPVVLRRLQEAIQRIVSATT